MATQYVQPSPNVAYVTQQYMSPDPISEAPYKHKKVFLGLGITQMVLSVISAILGITLAVYANIYEEDDYFYDDFYDDYFGRIAPGVWCGAFFFTSGILGVISAKKKTRCLVVAALTMAIFSSLAASTLLGLEITGAIIATDPDYNSRKHWDVSAAIHSTLSSIAFVELVVSIIHAAYCCNCKCCEQPQQYCISPQQIASSGYVNPVASAQIQTSQPQTTYVQTAPQLGSPAIQQPVILRSAPMLQIRGYQVQQVPQAVVVQPQQPSNQQHQQQENPPTYQNPEKSRM